MRAAARSTAPPAVDGRAFRDALGRFATGVAFVTAAPAGRAAGMVVNSFTSVSMDPPLVSFCPSRQSRTWAQMRETRRFAVNVLARGHEAFAVAATPPGGDRFADAAWRPGRGGVPILADALAAITCRIVAEHPAGDHWIVVGQVEDLAVAPPGDPLVFFAGAFGSFDAPSAPRLREVA